MVIHKMKLLHYLIFKFIALLILITGCDLFVDLEPPHVKILSPEPNEIVHRIAKIVVEASDNKKVDHVELYLNDTLVHYSKAASFIYDWNIIEPDTATTYQVRAKAFDAQSNWNEAKVSFLGYSDQQTKPILLSPADAGTVPFRGASFKWSTVDGAESYHVQIDNNPDFSSPFIDDIALKTNHYSLPVQMEIGTTYYWRIRTKYEWEEWSDWSNHRHFSTTVYIWRYKTSGSMNSSPAIGFDGTIYAGSGNGNLYALNPDGSLKWKFQTNGSVDSSPAIGFDGTIYVGSADNNFYAINPDGILKWYYSTTDDIFSSPAIGEDGTLYIGSDDKHLYAMNPDGSLKWKYKTDGRVICSPVIDLEGTIYTGSTDFHLYAMNPDGTLKWKYRTNSILVLSPAIGNDGTIYVFSYDNYFYAIGRDGLLKWKRYTHFSGNPVVAPDGTIYIGQTIFFAFNPNGGYKWQKDMGEHPILSAPAIGSDGTIYLGIYQRKFQALNSDGSLKMEYAIVENVASAPAIGNEGTIYMGCTSGWLYALPGLSKGLADGIWPKFRGDSQNTGRQRMR